MDISLHSFILVVGVIVIGFIVWDGVKKVRAARANRLDQSLEGYDSLDTLVEDQELPAFDDLEIKEEFLKQDLSGQSEQSITFDSPESVSHTTKKASKETHQEQPKEQEARQQASEPVFDVLDVEAVRVTETTQEQGVEDDGFEHFSARREDPADLEVNPVVAKSANVKAQHASTQDKRAETVLAQQKVSTQKVTGKVAPQRASKEELAAQLAKAKAEAKEQVAKTDVVVEEIKVDDKEPVPVLMEPVELGQKVDPNPPKQHELVLPEFIQQTLQDEPIYAEQEEPVEENTKPDVLMEYIEDIQAQPVGEKLSEREAAQEIFVINILKQDGTGLSGKDLHNVFSVCDMRHGEMDIFHRFEKANAQGKIQFSVVNAIEPGTFDLKTIDELVTPGISLFMSLPGPDKPMEAFDAMAEVALVFARNFNATLHDDTHSDLTPQTLEHYRNRVREFSRKHLSHKK